VPAVGLSDVNAHQGALAFEAIVFLGL